MKLNFIFTEEKALKNKLFACFIKSRKAKSEKSCLMFIQMMESDPSRNLYKGSGV